MSDPTKMLFVGLDVHKDSIVVAVAEAGRVPARAVATVPFEWNALRKVLERLGPKTAVSCCYEAGPTGYGLARSLRAAGWACDVIAPSLIPKKPGERIKTDRRDAAKLAQNHRGGDLVAVAIPDEACEAIRDLERARDDAKKAERVARQQLSKFLLRQGRRYPGKTAWNDFRGSGRKSLDAWTLQCSDYNLTSAENRVIRLKWAENRLADSGFRLELFFQLKERAFDDKIRPTRKKDY